MTLLTGYNLTNLPGDTLFGEGVIYIGATPFGVTKGPPKWNPNRTFQSIDFDGKYADVKGTHRPINGTPTLAFTMIEFGSAATGNQIAKLEPGSTVATVGAVTTHTPAPSGVILAAGAYQTDVRAVWERKEPGSGIYVAVRFPTAFFAKYDIAGQDKREALISVEVWGVIDTATQQLNAPAYVIEERTTVPT